jgi:pilus assembly protein Flp/PilA
LEYALILVLVAIVVLVILAVFGPAVGNMYSNVIAGF